MKNPSISGMVCYSNDLAATRKFYESLGFKVDKKEKDSLIVSLGDFWLNFVPQSKETKEEFKQEALAENKGAGMFLYIRVGNVNEFYDEMIMARGLKPSSRPRDWPWGNREFAIRDPDGYKLVFFNKK